MTRKTAIVLIVFLLLCAVAVPVLLHWLPRTGKTRVIQLEARKYGYRPARIVVNLGDTIIFKPTSKDVTHGFFLDGYHLEFLIKQEGIAYLKYSWEDDDGRLHTDWDKVGSIKLVADRAGKFVFRCTQTCGNLHPFMSGELVVRPNTAYAAMVSLAVWTVLSLLLWLGTSAGSKPASKRVRIDLLKALPGLGRIVKWRGFHFAVLLPSAVIFYVFILSALWGSPVGNRNIAIIFVWILWWFALKAVFVPLGARLWCLVCPLPAPAEWLSRKALTAVRYIPEPVRGLHHRFWGRQRDWPRPLRNMWLQNLIFMTMISFGIILITRPVATAALFLLILATTLVLALLFRRRMFCRYLCPVGGFLGNYSMASMTEVRAIDPGVCRNHREKSCLVGSPDGWACPWGEYMGGMDRNNFCGFCMECVKSCPKNNISVFVRPFGSDTGLKGLDEVANVLIMLAVAVAFSVTMLGPWGFIKDAANVTETRRIGWFLAYVSALWSFALVLFPVAFTLAVKAGNRLAGSPAPDRIMLMRLAYILIPVGIFAWIAFSLPPVLINRHYILVVLSDPFGFGWDLLGTAGAKFNPWHPDWIPLLQGVLLVVGLFLGIGRGFAALESVTADAAIRAKALVGPSLFALVVVIGLLRLYMG